jgi:Raf kinase inhibitor-like YbhB/YbcL family protein
MIISSSAFENSGVIPERYTCDGDNINPSLNIKSVPAGAKSLVLVVDDPDAPAGSWIHWTVWNINPETAAIAEGSVSPGAVEGVTSFGSIGYGGPCPSVGAHRYFFKLFALDTILELKSGATYGELESMMSGHILAKTELMGQYQRGTLR